MVSSPRVLRHQLTLVASPSALRQQLTLLGSPASGFAAPAVHTPWPAVHNFIPLPPKRCERHSHFSPNCRLPAIRSPNACSPAIRPGWRVLRQQLTLLGSPAFGTSAPCLRMVSSPRVLRQQLTLLGSPASGFQASPHLRCTHSVLRAYACVLTASTSPTTYVVGLTCIRLRRTCGARYFGFVLTHKVLTTFCRGIRLKLTHYRLLLFRLFSFLLELPPPVFWAALLIPLDSFLKRAGSTPGWAEEFNASGTP